MTLKAKLKPCNGIGLAYGFEGCKKPVLKREHGLCDSCRYDFYTTDERGKAEYQKRDLKNKKKAWNEQKKVLKEKTKTLSDYEAEAKKSFQKFIRLRDAGKPCKSCQNPHPSDEAGGHYFPAGIYSGLMFDERNCHLQCNTYCNKHLSGNPIEYRKNLVLEFGEKWMEQLEEDANRLRDYKYTKFELIEIKKTYDEKIKSLTKG